jgi:hypothetical protein
MEILTNALEGRRREITEYQVNIDNFRLAIDKISDSEIEMQPFKAHLQTLLQENIIEQRKSQIMLEVIEQQLS